MNSVGASINNPLEYQHYLRLEETQKRSSQVMEIYLRTGAFVLPLNKRVFDIKTSADAKVLSSCHDEFKLDLKEFEYIFDFPLEQSLLQKLDTERKLMRLSFLKKNYEKTQEIVDEKIARIIQFHVETGTLILPLQKQVILTSKASNVHEQLPILVFQAFRGAKDPVEPKEFYKQFQVETKKEVDKDLLCKLIQEVYFNCKHT